MQPPRSGHFRRSDDLNIVQNEAFLLSDAKIRAGYARAYESSTALRRQAKLRANTFSAQAVVVQGAQADHVPGKGAVEGRLRSFRSR
jgi:hypothetical protein